MAGIALRQPFARTWFPTRRPPSITPILSQNVILWIGASLLLVAAALNFYLFQVSIVATSAYDLQRLQQERDDWSARNQQLELELAKVRSVSWVRYKATQDLHMVQGGEPVYLRRTPHAVTPPAVPAPVVQPAFDPISIDSGAAAAVEEPDDIEDQAEEAPELHAPPTSASRAG